MSVVFAPVAFVSGQTPLDSTFENYCVTCHDNQQRTGGLSLEAIKPTQTEILEKVWRKLRSGEMPPAGMPAPDAAERRGIVQALEARLDKAAPNPGAAGVHRLNRAEYRNAVRDLTGLDRDHGANIPSDDSSYGFDNVAAALTVSPLHMEKYISSARRIARVAVGTGRPRVSVEKISPSPGTAGDSIDALPPAERGAIQFRRYFPADASYTFVVRLKGNPAPGMPPANLDFRVDGRRVKLFEASLDSNEANQGTRNFEHSVKLTAGDHAIAAGLLTELAKAEIMPRPNPFAPQTTVNSVNPLSVDYVTVAGPYDAVAGPGNTESRRRIFSGLPLPGQPETVCAQQILSKLTRQAYRRPVTAADVAPLLKLFAQGRASGQTFDSGIELALSAILVSPSFLFRSEGASDFDLASRLSFFLWSSIPDEPLLQAAASGTLRNPVTLRAQVKRMLADPKSHALVENFAGQWLHLRNVPSWKPDPEKYPQFDEPLRNAFEREAELFFLNIVLEDASVLDFVDAGYTFVNERLALHYGIPGVKGSYFRKVQLTEAQRGGVLSQGAVLLVTSYPTRTSPVLRGKWVLENILGSPPPPPPPNVPPLDASASTSAKSLRQQLEKHRANPACASCHSRLDPLGFSLEQFDGIGHFREKEGDAEVEASGSLPDGTTVNGLAGLKKVVLDRKDEFVECLAAKILTYALGRGLESYDQPTVRAIRRSTANDGYRFSSLVLGVIQSVPFMMGQPTGIMGQSVDVKQPAGQPVRQAAKLPIQQEVRPALRKEIAK